MYMSEFCCYVLLSFCDGDHQRFTHETRKNSEQTIDESKLKPSFIMSNSTKVISTHWIRETAWELLRRTGHLQSYETEEDYSQLMESVSVRNGGMCMLGGWVNPHREQLTMPQGQTSIPPKSFFTPTANGQIAPWSGSARGVGRGAGSYTPSTASESFSHVYRCTYMCTHTYTSGMCCAQLLWGIPGLTRAGGHRDGLGSYVFNTYSRIPVTQPHEYEKRISPGETCIWQEQVHIQD